MVKELVFKHHVLHSVAAAVAGEHVYKILLSISGVV